MFVNVFFFYFSFQRLALPTRPYYDGNVTEQDEGDKRCVGEENGPIMVTILALEYLDVMVLGEEIRWRRRRLSVTDEDGGGMEQRERERERGREGERDETCESQTRDTVDDPECGAHDHHIDRLLLNIDWDVFRIPLQLLQETHKGPQDDTGPDTQGFSIPLLSSSIVWPQKIYAITLLSECRCGPFLTSKRADEANPGQRWDDLSPGFILTEHMRMSREMRLEQLGGKKSVTSSVATVLDERTAGGRPSTPGAGGRRPGSGVVPGLGADCYVPAARQGGVLPMTADDEDPEEPEMVDSQCQTRESLFRPSPPPPPPPPPPLPTPHLGFTTFGYSSDSSTGPAEPRATSMESTKSAPDVIMTH
ncbi:hypothetical protein AAG570_007071 [Ranatra chinensis]|uniref:Uncharacterized protein n=1 Tax=Ranatra chinensis TaxID=642074 RepID=A0ABD0YIN3_9HEMI